MKIQVQEGQKDGFAHWYSSKPKYPLHVYVLTTAGLRGCITGMEQYFYGDLLSWRYQITQLTEEGPVSSWWTEADIAEVLTDTMDVEELENDKVVSSRYLTGLESINQFVQEYGKEAIARYHQTGSRRELRICFWDAFTNESD